MLTMTREQALAILELHKTVKQPTALLMMAIKVASEIQKP
jgi:hypothetical protein